MTLLMKDPGAVLDYSIDWGAEYLGGDLRGQSARMFPSEKPESTAPRKSARRLGRKRRVPCVDRAWFSMEFRSSALAVQAFLHPLAARRSIPRHERRSQGSSMHCAIMA